MVVIKNPIAFLNKAIKENWCSSKTKLEVRPQVNESKQISKKQSISKEENVIWFNSLTDKEKTECFNEAIFKFPMLKQHMEYRKLNFLDDGFTNSDIFIMFIQILNR